jgi:hypothetical protein
LKKFPRGKNRKRRKINRQCQWWCICIGWFGSMALGSGLWG